MRTHFDDRRPGERGFILVGVVTFMLALTILGLSLFALSSFEAQFFTTSVSREQSLQNAESGMELAKVLLSQSPSPQRLEAVQQAVGQFGVTSALAYQRRSGFLGDTTSQGPVNWDSTLTLVVSARSGGVVRTLEAQYRPGDNPYRRLLTAGTGVRVIDENDSPSTTLELRGGVWHPVASETDTAWTSELMWLEGRPVQTNRPPLPLADAFVDARLADPTTTVPWKDFEGESRLHMQLLNPLEGVKYFRSPLSPSGGESLSDYTEYSFFAHQSLTITIRGTVVWVVSAGVSFYKDVVIDSDDESPATLVIVAKRNGTESGNQNRGIKFRGGLKIPNTNTRLFLVSEGDISITRENSEDENQNARRLSVVAGGRIELGRPDPGYHFRLTYDAEDMDPLAEQLLSAGALPAPAAGSSTTFQLVPSSWIESTPR